MATLPLQIFPGFTAFGVVSDQVQEIATVFNAEGIDALSTIPEKPVAWAGVGTRVTPGMFQVKIPIRLTSLLGFEPFDGERKYHQVNVASVSCKVSPSSLGVEWPVQITQSGNAQLVEFYGAGGIAGDIISHARAYKADLCASLIIGGLTNSSLSMTAQALTLPQPGLSSGLPLFSDGSTSGSSKHYSNPLNGQSAKFSNLTLNAGQITTSSVFAQMLLDMSQVPHPSKQNMTLGLEVTDIVGGTNMLIPFWQAAVQNLSLQTTTSQGNLAGATTNIFNPKLIAERGPEALIGAAGIAPWRFWIAPQLDAHPYIVANPTKQMWFSVSRTRQNLCWGELAGPSAEFTPTMTLLGDGTEECKKTRKVRLFGDIDGGAAAGLPHCIHMYTETTP